MKRYNAVQGGVYDNSVMVEENDGDWVWYEEVEHLEAINAELLEALESVVAIAKEAHAHWDADRDSRVGKILLALAGANEAYDNRIDWIHAAIAKAKGETL